MFDDKDLRIHWNHSGRFNFAWCFKRNDQETFREAQISFFYGSPFLGSSRSWLSQWPTFKLLGIPYLVRKINFNFYFMDLWLSKVCLRNLGLFLVYMCNVYGYDWTSVHPGWYQGQVSKTALRILTLQSSGCFEDPNAPLLYTDLATAKPFKLLWITFSIGKT